MILHYWRYYLIVLLSIALLLGFGCKKETTYPANTFITGHVTDKCTGQAVGNLTISLFINDLSSQANYITFTTTDANGNYSISFYARDNAVYCFLAGDGVEVDHISKGSNQTIDFQVGISSEYLNLAVTIFNSSPQTANDSIYVKFKLANDTSYWPKLSYVGQSINTSEIVSFKDCFPYTVDLNWVVRKNNVLTYHADTVQYTTSTPPNYTINY